MFPGLKKTNVMSKMQRNLHTVITRRGAEANPVTKRMNERALQRENRAAGARGFAAVPIRRLDEHAELDEELLRLRKVQTEAVAEDMSRYPRAGRPPMDEEDDDAHVASSSSRRPRYDDVNQTTGNSSVQEWFDELVRDAIVRYCPPNTDSLRPSELLAVIRQRMPTFSFKEHCDGMPFSLLIKNCNYLKSFGGKVSFLPIRESDARTDEDEQEVSSSHHDNGGGDAVLGLRKYKLREAPSWEGVRQGPQPWLYDGKMLNFRCSKR